MPFDDGRLEPFRVPLNWWARSQLPPRLRSKIDSSDLVQQTMVQALENGRQFQGNNDAELAGWLKAIAANVLLNELRKYKTQARDVDQEMSLAIDQSSARLEAVLAADQSTPSQHAVRDEQLLRQAAALEQLPADQRAALILHYLEELSLKETAERLGRSEAAVAGLVKRGLRELRRRMRE